MSNRTVVRSPVVAAALSFLIPGLGQAAVGKPRRGAVIAIPFLATIGVLLLIVIVARGKTIDAALNQQWLSNLLIVDLILLVCHVFAIVDSYLIAAHNQSRVDRRNPAATKWGPIAAVGLIVAGTVAIHGGVASLDMTAQGGLSCINDSNGQCMFGDGPTLAPGQTIAMTTDDPNIVVDPNGSPDASGPTATPTGPVGTFDPSSLPSSGILPTAADWAADGQLNVLLAGIDAGSGGGRNSGLRPDTMIVVHIDLKSGRAALIGIPRNTQCVPLPRDIAAHYATNSTGCPGSTYPNMLNWLANDAGWNHPTWFPFLQGKDSQGRDQTYARAMSATQVAIETLTGLTIDGFAVINLEGLVTIIDDFHGIDITVPKNLTAYDLPCGPKGTWAAKYRVCAINPPHGGYPIANPGVIPHMIADAAQSGGLQVITAQVNGGYGIGFTVKAGFQHMDGDWALAYARTRIYTTDYNRMMRQQLVLKAIRQTINPCTLLPNLGKFLGDVGPAFWTNLPLADNASTWAGLAKYITGDNVKSITLDPASLGNPRSTYINPTTWAKAKYIVAHSLDSVPAANGSGAAGGGGGGGFSC
jgi:anionic cell wall polymer biosynthesis LytR-Cps2A-Psr (LCP) family protein/TM2 domain-containing membrane protein YozV